MPKIPQYDVQVTPQATSPVLIPEGAASSAAEGQTAIAQQMADMSAKWYQIETLKEKTKATADYHIELAQIESQASADEDFSKENLSKYQQRIKDAQAKYISTITDGPTRSTISESFKVDGWNSYFKISNEYNARTLQNLEYQTYKTIEANREIYVNSNDERIKKKVYQDTLDLVDESVQARVMSPSAGTSARAKIKDMWDADWQKEQVQKAINTDPFLAETMIVQGDFGELDAQERADWLRIADSAQKKVKADKDREVAEIKSKNEDYFQEKYFNNDLSINELTAALEIPESEGGPSRELLNTMKKNLLSSTKVTVNEIAKKGPDVARARKFLTATTAVLNKDVDLLRSRQILIEAAGDGVITNEEAKVLDDVAKLANDYRYAKRSDMFASWWNKIKSLAGKFDRPAEQLEQDLRNYLLMHTKEQDSEANGKEVIKQMKEKQYPQYKDWEPSKPYQTIIGTVKFIDYDEDMMPIVEIMNAE